MLGYIGRVSVDSYIMLEYCLCGLQILAERNCALLFRHLSNSWITIEQMFNRISMPGYLL